MTIQKQAGTAAETAFVRYALANGFLTARRETLFGSGDRGDVRLAESVIVELKHRRTTTGNAALGQPGAKELAGWMAETERERINAGATYAALVVKRAGTTDVGQWWCYIPMWQLAHLWGFHPDLSNGRSQSPICMTVDSWFDLLKAAGLQ